jgi:competence protein ComEC
MLIDLIPTYDLKSVKFDWILLRNSPKINLEKVIKILKPKLIIADGSNYKSYVKRWQKTCTKKVSILMILLRMALLFMT